MKLSGFFTVKQPATIAFDTQVVETISNFNIGSSHSAVKKIDMLSGKFNMATSFLTLHSKRWIFSPLA